MRTRTKWALAGGSVAIVGLLAGLGYYEHKKHSAPAATVGGVQRGGLPGPIRPGVSFGRFNPNLGSGGNQKTVTLATGQTSATVAAQVGDIIDVVFADSGAFVSSAEYGVNVQWGTGAAPGSKQVSVQITGPDTISVTWSSDASGGPARYTSQVQVTT